VGSRPETLAALGSTKVIPKKDPFSKRDFPKVETVSEWGKGPEVGYFTFSGGVSGWLLRCSYAL